MLLSERCNRDLRRADQLLNYLGLAPIVSLIIPWIFAIGILVYGHLTIKKEEKEKPALEGNT